MKKKYAEIVFLQDKKAEESLNLLEECGEEEAMSHLKQWDTGEYSEEMDTTGAGSCDREYRSGNYIMTWNSGVGYIGLCLDITESKIEV